MSTSKTSKRETIFDAFDNRCLYCGVVMGLRGPKATKPTVDHVVPRALGGGGSYGNLVAACLGCNMERQTEPIEAFIARKATTPALMASLLGRWRVALERLQRALDLRRLQHQRKTGHPRKRKKPKAPGEPHTEATAMMTWEE